jgi:hypothetical protein
MSEFWIPRGEWGKSASGAPGAPLVAAAMAAPGPGAISIASENFDRDSGNNPITPVDVLMAGFWNLNVAGLEVGQKTVKSGSVGAQGAWAMSALVPWSNSSGQVRSFASYTDSATHREMAFAGSDPYGIFSGAFTPSSGGVQWGASAEAGTTGLANGRGSSSAGRVMSFAACGGKLYASIYDTIVVRTDGENPSWRTFHKYSGPALPSTSSGFRGLTCVPNLSGAGSMLIAALESDSADIHEFPLNGSQPTVELHTSNFLSSALGTWVGYGIAAYNDMVVDPHAGTPDCPTLLIGLNISARELANTDDGFYPTASFLVRHCNGAYGFRTIVDPSITPAPPLFATRTLAVSQFPGDPAGTIYAGGYDAHYMPAHNTDWIYRGVPK